MNAHVTTLQAPIRPGWKQHPGWVALLALATLWLSASAGYAATKTVTVVNTAFQPANVTIAVGDTVRWVWSGGTHSTTSGSCSGGVCTPVAGWDSPTKSSGDFSHTFGQEGTFPYFCRVHGSMMQGTVHVTAPPPLAATAAAAHPCGQAPLSVTFSGSASGGAAPYTFAWTFGDGASSTVQNPTHLYDAAGSPNAVLQVTDAQLAVASDSVAVQVSADPIAVITKVKKLTDPLRLVITGTGFPANCTIRINGQPVPISKCTSATKVVAKGGADLKAMLPRGTTVTVTVHDNDANADSCPGSFTRAAGSSGSPGDGDGGHDPY